jgi:hypothetical protein
VAGAQVNENGTLDAQRDIHLSWQWSLRDVGSLLVMLVMTATVNAQGVASDPGFAVSFSAGLALRIVLHEIMPHYVAQQLGQSLHSFRVVIDNADDVVTRYRAMTQWCVCDSVSRD